MDFELEETIPFPIDRVYPIVRDEMADIADFMPDIEKIEVLEREELDEHRVRFRNVWHSSAKIPRMARAFVPKEITVWTDDAIWDESAHTTEWELTMHAFSDAIDVSGKNQYEDRGDETIFRMKGEFHLDLKKIRGIPRFLAGKRLRKTIESFILKLLSPNMRNFAIGANRYLKHLSED